MKLYWNKIEFEHKGDAVTYVFPWARKKSSQRYFSIGFNSYFPSLKALDDLWDEYWKALRDEEVIVVE